MNWIQKIILIVGGLSLLLVAFVESDGWEDDPWIAFVAFCAAIACFVLAASKRKQQNG